MALTTKADFQGLLGGNLTNTGKGEVTVIHARNYKVLKQRQEDTEGNSQEKVRHRIDIGLLCQM